jgi:hypothetical protein
MWLPGPHVIEPRLNGRRVRASNCSAVGSAQQNHVSVSRGGFGRVTLGSGIGGAASAWPDAAWAAFQIAANVSSAGSIAAAPRSAAALTSRASRSILGS